MNQMMTPSTLARFVSGILISLAAGSMAEEVSRQAPAGYEKHLAPLLTPLEEVRRTADPFVGEDEPGSVRLSEVVTRVEEDGTYLRAVHQIFTPYSERGVESVSSDRHRFAAHQERVHLVMARTILADGTIKQLGPNAAFIQKGRRGSSSVYDDSQDLVIVYPDVRPGVLCESVIVYERTQASVAGGYSQVMSWQAGWPVVRKRAVVDLPASWEKRLQVRSIGREVEPALLKSPQGRVVREWSKDKLESGYPEPSRAPSAQLGPVTWLTTFADWDEVAAWYQSLLNERGDLGKPLEGQVDAWTAQAKGQREILEILFRKVADEVRYEGLEFGISGLQPYRCQTVWQNQYGDCKDKSNLLVAMLRHKGIHARLALVNTEHAGLIDRRIPDFRHFDHAIVVVKLESAEGGAEWVFCDPTIEHGWPGLLSPGSGGRDVLAVDGGKALWLKSPEVSAGSRRHAFELKLSEEGRVSGWLTVQSEGLYAIHDVSRFSGLDRQSARSRLASLADEFIPGATVVDFVLPAAKPVDGKTEFKVFIAAPPRQADEGGRLSVVFPSSSRMFYDYGDQEKRRTPYFQWRDRVDVEASIELPAGWRPEALPSPIELGSEAYRVRASWSFKDELCRARLTAECLQAVIPAGKVAVPAQANRALHAWLDVPLMLKQGGKVSPRVEVDDVALPLMPTGEGQLNLVDELYPATGDTTKRRKALEKVIRFFPNDPAAAFDARTRIGLLFYQKGEYADAVVHFAKLLANPADVIDPESVAWAGYLHGLCLDETGKRDRALALMQGIAGNDQYSSYRRGWAAMMAARWMHDGGDAGPQVAALLEQALLSDADCEDNALPLLLRIWLGHKQGGRIEKLLATPGVTDNIEDGGVAVMVALVPELDAEAGGRLLAHLESVAGSDETAEGLKQALTKAAEEIRKLLAERMNYIRVREAMNAVFKKHAPDYRVENPHGEDVDALIEALEKLPGTGHREWLQLAAVYFRDFDSTRNFGRICWLTLDHARFEHGHDDKGLEFVHAVAGACDKLPASDDHLWECLFVIARVHEGQQQWAAAEAVYRRMLDDEKFNHEFNHSAWHRLGNVLEIQGRLQQAVDCYRRFADDRDSYQSVTECLLRAGLLQAQLGQHEQALETWKLLLDVPTSIYDDSPLLAQIMEAILLAKSPAATLAQWQRTDAWWEKEFLPFLKAAGVGDLDAQRVFLPDQATEIDARCRQAVAAKDFKTVARDLKGVALSARWLPCSLNSLWGMMRAYVMPMRPQSGVRVTRVMMGLCAANQLGLPQSIEMALRIRAASAVNLNEPELALSIVADQLAEAEGRSDEHRERCVILMMMAAAQSGTHLEEALKHSRERLNSGLRHVDAVTWSTHHADLLIKAQRVDEAVAFLEQQLQQAAVKRDPNAHQLSEKLDGLSRTHKQSQAFKLAALRLLEHHRPGWYDHVGPRQLDDPRVGDLEALGDGELTRFHEAEAFRLRMLALQSDKVSVEAKSEALVAAVIPVAKWQGRWDEAEKVINLIVDDEALDSGLRRRLLWLFCSEITTHGLVEISERLLNKPVMKGDEAKSLRELVPGMLLAARAVAEGPHHIRDAFKEMSEKELGSLDLMIVEMHHAVLLGKGDFEGAGQLRDALKDWKMSPEAVGKRNSSRLKLMKQARESRKSVEVVGKFEQIGAATIQQLATGAPAGWRLRVDMSDFYDLSQERKAALLAARKISGFGYDKTELSLWCRHPEFWLGQGGNFDHDAHLKALAAYYSAESDMLTPMCLISLLGDSDVLERRNWEAIDRCLKDNAPAHEDPSKQGIIAYWQALRDFKPGARLDLDRLLTSAKKTGFMGNYMLNDVLTCALVNGDRKAIEAVVAAMDAEMLEETQGILVYLKALKVLGRAEEAELLMETAERAVDVLVMDSWMGGSAWSAFGAFMLAKECGLEERLPERWRKDMTVASGDPMDAAFFKAMVAELNQDWQGMKAALDSVKLDAGSKTLHHLMSARACIGLKQKEPAREHLRQILTGQMMEFQKLFHAWCLLQDLEDGE